MTAEPATDIRGLDHAAVLARVEAGKVNAAPPMPGRSGAQILRANVLTRFNAILGSLFVVVMVVGPPQDALFSVVLVVNTGVGIFQEVRAKLALDELAILTAARARVVRDGAAAELPVDQVVLLQQGTSQILRMVAWVIIPAGLLLIVSPFFRSHEPLGDAGAPAAARCRRPSRRWWRAAAAAGACRAWRAAPAARHGRDRSPRHQARRSRRRACLLPVTATKPISVLIVS